MTKKIHIEYFAVLQDQRGLSRETVETDAADTAALYKELQELHELKQSTCTLKVALNDEFADWQTALTDGDKVVFIPPVAGG